MIDITNLVRLTISLIIGILLGYLLRNRKPVNLSKVTFGTILILIFSLGFSIGANNELLGSMPNIGLNALVILSLSLFFSVVFVMAVKRLVKVE